MSKYEKLTDRQKKVFNSYIKTRTLHQTAIDLDMNEGDLSRVYQSDNFQLALSEYNNSIADKVGYNAAVIIDKLWGLYNDEDVPNKEKINILVLLGKHIGMWANAVREKDAKASIQYNIVNYNGVREEIQVHAQEIKQVENETPAGFKILEFNNESTSIPSWA